MLSIMDLTRHSEIVPPPGPCFFMRSSFFSSTSRGKKTQTVPFLMAVLKSLIKGDPEAS